MSLNRGPTVLIPYTSCRWFQMGLLEPSRTTCNHFKDPKEQVREMKRKLRHEQRAIDRNINHIKREELKVKKSLQEAAKAGNKDVCKILAKEMIGSRRAVSKLHASKAQINSVCMQMDSQAAMVKMSGSMKASTDVMKLMNKLTKVSEISQTMMELQKEMTKAGIMEEMMEDTMGMDSDEELDEAADEEVEKILFEVTKGQLGTDTAISTPIAGEAEEEIAGPANDYAARTDRIRKYWSLIG
eukprot:sb/3469009/